MTAAQTLVALSLAATVALAHRPGRAQGSEGTRVPGTPGPAAEGHTRKATTPTLVVDRRLAITRGSTVGPGVRVSLAPQAAARSAEEAATPFVRPPTLSLFAGYRGGAPFVGPELSAALTQDVALRGLGDARRDAAAQLRETVQRDVEHVRLAAAHRALAAWIGAIEAKEVHRLRALALTHAEAIATSTRARVGSGVGQPRERALADGDVGTALAATLEAEGGLVEMLAELRHVLALPETEVIDVSGDVYTAGAAPPPEERVLRQADGHPAVLTARAKTGLAAREKTLARALLGPYATVGGSFAREASGEHIVGATFGLPLVFVDPSKFEEARLRAHEDSLRAMEHYVLAEVRRDISLAVHDREHWHEVVEALRTRAVGPLREALRLAQKEYEVGTQDVAMVLLARQKLLGAEEQLARASAALLRAEAHLAYLTGSLKSEVEARP